MTEIKTVYEHIRSNDIKTWILVALFPLIFIALIFLFTWCVAPINQAIETTATVGIPTIILCLAWLGISWFFGDSMMLNMAGAHQIQPDTAENKEIYRLVENVALAAGLPVPRVYIIDDNSMNAFATGRSPKDASVALTRGIIKRLDKTELQGVIAHEMAHIGNRDIRLDMMLITGVGVTVFLGDILMQHIRWGGAVSSSNDDNDNKNMGAILIMVWLAFMVFNALIVPILRMAVSRNREYGADATGAYITRNPHALASALKKISTDARVEKLDSAKSMAVMCIENPMEKRAFLGELFSTHPATEKRIKRLETMSLK